MDTTIHDTQVIGLIIAVTGLVIIGISIPLIRGRIPMNGYYGIRIPKAFVSDSNWYTINAYGGRVLAIAGAIVSLFGLIIRLRPPTSNTLILIATLSPAIVLVLSIIPVLIFSRHLPSGTAK